MSAEYRESLAGSVTDVLEWIEIELLCGMVMRPRSTEDRVCNDAHHRALGIVRQYRNGDGLFQMTRSKEE